MTITDIGEFRNALLCITNYSDCCGPSYPYYYPRRIGEWYFHNGSVVEKSGFGYDFYRSRGLNVVRLNRRNNATFPTGIYRCNIPVSDYNDTDIYIGVYNSESGKLMFFFCEKNVCIRVIHSFNIGFPNITSFEFNRDTISLICYSTGGPVTTLTWMKNDKILNIDGLNYQQEKIILDSVTATYKNVLYSDNVSNLVGVFTCIVQNARGKSNMSFSTNGMLSFSHTICMSLCSAINSILSI